MPRTRSLAWSQLKIGILAVVAVVLAFMLVFAVGGESGLFTKRYHLKTRFANVQGLKSGAVVRLAGVQVGQVDDVYLSGRDVEVVLRVRADVQDKITDRSRAQIGSVSLLGEGAVEITSAPEGTPLPDWGTLESERTPGQIAEVAENASLTLEQATALLEDIRAGRGTVGKLFAEDALYRDVAAFVASAEGVVQAVNAGKGPLGKLVNDPKSAAALEAALANLETITTGIARGEGTLGQLLTDDALARSLTETTANLERLTNQLATGDGTAARLINDPALYNRLDSLTQRLDELVTGLNSGEGTAGQLLHDRQLYENMTAAASELRSLVEDVRKDPKKFLNVRVSIF
jgi:phospholipid/cholesterol/gamma-HCH transport system substrate-binding protein